MVELSKPKTIVRSDRPRPSLTRRASLNALAAGVDYTARISIQLVLAPLLLRFLGDAGYGIWQVLQRLIGQASPASGRNLADLAEKLAARAVTPVRAVLRAGR